MFTSFKQLFARKARRRNHSAATFSVQPVAALVEILEERRVLSTTPVYTLYTPNTPGQVHFFTTNADEATELERLGWVNQTPTDGTGMQVLDSQEPGAQPVHRLYNGNTGEHYYTLSDGERDQLVRFGWNYEKDEGFMFSAEDADAGTRPEGVVPVYRVYTSNQEGSGHGDHLITTDSQMVDGLVSRGWEIHSPVGFTFPATGSGNDGSGGDAGGNDSSPPVAENPGSNSDIPQRATRYSITTSGSTYYGPTSFLYQNPSFSGFTAGYSFTRNGTLVVTPTIDTNAATNNGYNIRDVAINTGTIGQGGAGNLMFSSNSLLSQFFGGGITQNAGIDVSYVQMNDDESRLTITVDQSSVDSYISRLGTLNSFVAGNSQYSNIYNIHAGQMVIDFSNGGASVSGEYVFYGEGYIQSGTTAVRGSFYGTQD